MRWRDPLHTDLSSTTTSIIPSQPGGQVDTLGIDREKMTNIHRDNIIVYESCKRLDSTLSEMCEMSDPFDPVRLQYF